MAHAHAFQQLTAYIALRRFNGFQSLPGFTLVALNADKHARAFAIRRQQDFRHMTERNARVTEFALNDRADLFLQRLAYTFPVILFSALLRHGNAPRRKPMRISEKMPGRIGAVVLIPISRNAGKRRIKAANRKHSSGSQEGCFSFLNNPETNPQPLRLHCWPFSPL